MAYSSKLSSLISRLSILLASCFVFLCLSYSASISSTLHKQALGKSVVESGIRKRSQIDTNRLKHLEGVIDTSEASTAANQCPSETYLPASEESMQVKYTKPDYENLELPLSYFESRRDEYKKAFNIAYENSHGSYIEHLHDLLRKFKHYSARAEALKTKQVNPSMAISGEHQRQAIDRKFVGDTQKSIHRERRQTLKAQAWAKMSETKKQFLLNRYPNLARIYANLPSSVSTDKTNESGDIFGPSPAHLSQEELLQEMASGERSRQEFQIFKSRSKEFDKYDDPDTQFLWLQWRDMTNEERAKHDEDR